MNVTVLPSNASGTINAISSKSVAHRLLICAAFANESASIRCEQINEDIIATVNCLCALGAKIDRHDVYFNVTPIKEVNKSASLPCNESGSTLRFLLPVCAVLNGNFIFEMCGRLPERPLSPLKELLESNGVNITRKTHNTLSVSGTLTGENFEIAGNISSQFISGLLFALAISKKKSNLTITTKIESKPYVDITIDALSTFGINIIQTENSFTIQSSNELKAPKALNVEGDWSNAAFPLALGIIGNAPITVENLSSSSMQGDEEYSWQDYPHWSE